MTIKQQGGVFGRHPSFSTLEVEGESTLGPVSAEHAGTALTATRTGSEGEITAWYKDSTKVAGLNVLSGDAWFNVPDRAGLRYSGTSLIPLKNGAVADAQISLGSPIYRFANLYMSGNVIIGANSGIDFSATSGTGTSELFDDYEEGLFDVTAAASTSGTVTLDYTRLAYAKIGRVVFVTGEIRVSAVASPVGDITIGSLPFANSGLSQRSSRTSFFVEANTLTGAPTGIVQGAIAAGGTDIEIRLVDNFSFTSLASYLQANSAFKFCFAYHAA